jgi:hypothetical protein
LQKATSRGVSQMSVPTQDLNHWRSTSIRVISATGAAKVSAASW